MLIENSPDQKYPEMTFELKAALDEKYQLDAIRVHRVTRFRNTRLASILNVSELQDLMTKQKATDEGRVFRAFRHLVYRSPSEFLDAWYEVSVSCPELDEKLKENESLEFGEEAKWELKDVESIQGADQILHPSCEMLLQMDGVGYWSLNDLDSKSYEAPPSPPPQVVSDEAW